MPRAFVFDIDNTLTLPDKPPTPEVARTLATLPVPFFVAAGSGMDMLEDRFFRTLYDFGLRTDFDAFLCNGTLRYRCAFSQGFHIALIRDFSLPDAIGAERYARLCQEIHEVLAAHPLPASIPVLNEMLCPRVQERGAMINVAPTGRIVDRSDPEVCRAYNASRRAFEAFDAESGYRKAFRADLLPRLVAIDERLTVKFGGKTSFDINLRGEDKSFAVRALFEDGYDAITYFGDALFPGGNDEAVLQYQQDLARDGGVTHPLSVIQVNGPQDTLRRVKAMAFLSLLDLETQGTLALTEDVVSTYNLDPWAAGFSLMTAGYRDQLDPEDITNPATPFNLVTVAIMAEAKARVFLRAVSPGQVPHVHVGGEVRAHTQTFIQTMARIYAAHGYIVHLRTNPRTTPIWYSSFGTFYEEFLASDSFTASHSAFTKGGWKALDAFGQQITREEQDIIDEVKAIVSGRSTITLAPLRGSGRVLEDFNVDEPYLDLLKDVLGDAVLARFRRLAADGYRLQATPLGGSMGPTTTRLFEALGVPVGPDGVVRFFMETEDPRFHRVGEIDGENYGADACKPEIYRSRNVNAAGRLLDGHADIVFLWDPDGDRFNAVTSAPAHLMDRARDLGVEVEHREGQDRCVTFFSPNQLYMLLLDYRVRLLKASGEIEKFGWFVGASYPTTKALEELANHLGVPVLRVPVGFRFMGSLCRTLESGLGRPQVFESYTGVQTPMGPNPRALILCEESGGATFGGRKLLQSRHGLRQMLALREKDGMVVALLTLALAAELRAEGKTLVERYCDIIDEAGIESRYFVRIDVPLYDEALRGPALKEAKQRGVDIRDRTVAFFLDLVDSLGNGSLSVADIDARLQAKNTAGIALPRVQSAAWIRDGSMFQLEGLRFIVRASGTDALLRYYVDGRDREGLQTIAQFARGFSPG